MKPVADEKKCDCRSESQSCLVKPYYLPIGTVLRERYRVDKVLGEGGIKITYIGLDSVLERKVVINEIFLVGISTRNSGVSNDIFIKSGEQSDRYTNCLEQFINDSLIKLKISDNEGFLSYIDCFRQNNTAYVITESVEGENLKSYCKKKAALSYKEALDIMIPVINAIEETYRKNDNYFINQICPENIIVTKNGKGKLIELDGFFVADNNKNKAFSVILYPGYSAEELYSKKGEIGEWTYVYTFCSIIYYCLTGIVPPNVIERLVHDEIIPVHTLVSAFELKYSNAIMKGMEVKKENRYLTIKELVYALENGAQSMKSEKRKGLLSFFTKRKKNNSNRQEHYNFIRTANDNANYDQIISQIKAGLSGNPKKDMSYLRTQCEMYKNHILSTEILRECGRMMVELIPDKAKEEYANIVQNEEKNIEKAMEEVHYAVFRKDYEKALKLVEQLVYKADNNPMYKEDSVNSYFTFGEYFEEVLYRQVNSPQKEPRRANFPFARIYLTYGSLLVETGRYEEANVTLKKAMKWNPVNIGIRSEYMETLKKLGRLDEYYNMAVESFKYAFKSKDLARCFRNIGWYFVETKMYKEAMGVYTLSLKYDKDSTSAQSEMFFIQQMDASVGTPDIEELKSIGERHGFSTEPDATVLSCALSGALNFEVNGIHNGARYCYEILYDLTRASEIKEMMDKLPK